MIRQWKVWTISWRRKECRPVRVHPIVENKKAGLPLISPGEAGAGLCLVAPKDRTNTNVHMRVGGAVEGW